MNSIKYALLSLVLFAAAFGLAAQAPQWLWAVGAGGTADDYAWDIVVDSQGNQYVTGSFIGTSTFGAITLTSSGGTDIFIAKLDPQGNWLWAVKAGGTGDDEGSGICVDASGKVYVTGYFTDSASFGAGTLIGNGAEDIFFVKLNTNGVWQMLAQAGGSGFDAGIEIALDNLGNAYITGVFTSVCGFGALNLTSAGMEDTFVAKLGTNGSWHWATKAGGAASDAGKDIAVDGSGNVCITGIFDGGIDFGTINLTGSGGLDVFAAKLTSAGNWQWATAAGGTGDEESYRIAEDGSGNSYIVGYFEGTANFGNVTLNSSGQLDAFIASLDGNGNWLWATKGGGASIDGCYGLAVDSYANIFVCGGFGSSASFGSTVLTSTGAYDVFTAKLDSAGNWLWAVSAGGSSYDVGWGIGVDNSSHAYLAGVFRGTAGFGTSSVICNGGWDLFVAKLFETVSVSDDIAPSAPSVVLTASPNPFHEVIVLKAIPASQSPLLCNEAYIGIYDMKGRKVTTLPFDSSSTGEMGCTWNGRDTNDRLCPNGIYLARFVADGKALSSVRISLIK